MATTTKPAVTVQVAFIKMYCPCGGQCVDDDGAGLINATDITVICEKCNEWYSVPFSVFCKQAVENVQYPEHPHTCACDRCLRRVAVDNA